MQENRVNFWLLRYWLMYPNSEKRWLHAQRDCGDTDILIDYLTQSFNIFLYYSFVYVLTSLSFEKTQVWAFLY